MSVILHKAVDINFKKAYFQYKLKKCSKQNKQNILR